MGSRVTFTSLNGAWTDESERTRKDTFGVSSENGHKRTKETENLRRDTPGHVGRCGGQRSLDTRTFEEGSPVNTGTDAKTDMDQLLFRKDGNFVRVCNLTVRVLGVSVEREPVITQV